MDDPRRRTDDDGRLPAIVPPERRTPAGAIVMPSSQVTTQLYVRGEETALLSNVAPVLGDELGDVTVTLGGKSRQLVLVSGSTRVASISVLNGRTGQPEDLTAAEQATLLIYDGATQIALFKTETDTLFIDKPNRELVIGGAGFTAEVADALPAGLYCGQAAIRFGATDDDWQASMPFNVRIFEARAPKEPEA